MAYESLMQPLTVRNTIFPNRIALAPIYTDYAGENGEVTERLIRFVETIARNDVGLSIVGATAISPESRIHGYAMGLFEDGQISSARKLFSAVRRAGSIPAIQLNHAGRLAPPELVGGELVGPSARTSSATRAACRELSVDEIEEIVDQFVSAAAAAKDAGAAMVEFHGAHGYLLSQFLSPFENRRSDGYGGSTENRGRIVREILERARRRVGEDFILGLRISADEYMEGGLKVEESCRLVKRFIESGLDIVHVSGGGADSDSDLLEEKTVNGAFIELAGEIKKQVEIPVIAVGGIRRLEQAERVLERNLADMVAIGRGLIADPELVRKSLAGKPEDVVECTDCQACYEFFDPDCEVPGLACSVNPSL